MITALEIGVHFTKFNLILIFVYFTVMALFPQTTCFYKALVNKPPSTHNDEYELLFEDPSYTEGYSPPHSVVQRYVIAYKPKIKQGQDSSS